MKRYIIFSSIFMAAALVSCTDRIDNSEFSDMLGEDYNQKILWDVDSLAFRRAAWQTTDMVYGAKLRKATVSMLGSSQSVSYITYSPQMFLTRIAVSGDALRQTGEIASEHKAVFAINGGLFDAGGAADFVMVDSKVESDAAANPSDGAVAILDTQEGNTMSILSGVSSGDLQANYTSALATGPVLLKDGKEQEFPSTEEYTTRRARSIIGTGKNGEYIMAVIDGGATGHADGATMAEAAYIARLIGFSNAVSLSGGDASSLWNDSDGTVNHPSGSSHAVANIIYAEVNTPFEGGSGTKADPYRIATTRHIKNMASVLTEGSAVYFELTDDIDMTGIDWVPLNYADPYMKIVHLDGKGHTIYNFSCSYNSYPSFFGVLHGECRNIRFVNALINAPGNCCGIIGGYIGTAGKPGLLENSYIQGTVNMNSNQAAGGVAGQINTGTVRNCIADVDVNASASVTGQPNLGFGGIVGEMRNKCTVENNFVMGNINGLKLFNAGGTAGRSNGSEIVIRNNISWTESITGRVAVGGVVGRWKTANGTNENNYSNDAMKVSTYDNNGNPAGIYHSSDDDYADFGIKTSDATAAAKELGWDTSIWDLSGSLPSLILFSEK